MPEQVRCPSCNAALRVPENLLGKNVKCPKCQTTFRAEMEELAQPEGIVRERTPAASRSRAPDDVDDEELPPEEEEDRPRRRRRRRRGSAATESAVAGPAIAMMVTAGLDITWAIVDLLLRVLGVSFIAASAPKGRVGGPQTTDLAVSMAAGVGGDIIGACFAILILVGALKMKSLSSYALAMTACIISMLPCHACCCLGLPFGIWGLVILNKPEVKDAFSS